MEECKVSILCAAFNHEKYIRDALEGFVSQKTCFPFEVLVNDDCSTDSTAEIIREYAEKYPGIIRPFYQEKNLYSQGPAVIYDRVFYPNIRGKYVAYCEGDDYWTDPMKLQLQADFLDAHPDYSACVHNTTVHCCDGSEADRLLIPQSEDRDVGFETIIKGMSHCFHTSSFLVRKELIVNPPDFQRVAEAHRFSDYAIALWCVINGKVRFLDRSMSVYRVASNAASWSSGVGGQYDRLKEFVKGEAEMMRTMLPRLNAEQAALTEHTILEREYELLNIEGRVSEMMRAPYRDIYLSHGTSYRIKMNIKRYFPSLYAAYRRSRGYSE